MKIVTVTMAIQNGRPRMHSQKGGYGGASVNEWRGPKQLGDLVFIIQDEIRVTVTINTEYVAS